MKVSEIMSTPALSVLLDDSLGDVDEIFEREKIRHLLVVEGGELFGVLSDRDLLRAISPYVHTHIYTTRDLASLNQRVHQIVKRKPVSLNPDSTIDEAISLFKKLHIGCIPIVDAANVPVGIITSYDIICNFHKISSVSADDKKE